MESPVGYPESPMDVDDTVYPCKGCGEILEEGKAFELAGNRWHIDCFRCHSCGTLLDSDANLLLLGDGSLICNNCTYSCSSCGNKIEDLAILTGDQAFCSSCFRCRNCKRQIENLRYARTSQGIFCMSCHESLMARRRKKARLNAKPPSSNMPAAEKALPSLPPDASLQTSRGPSQGTPSDTNAQSPRVLSVETPPDIMNDSHHLQEQRSPKQRQMRSRNEGNSAYDAFKRDTSPLSDDTRRDVLSDSSQRHHPAMTPDPNADGPTLPASTYSAGKTRPPNFLDDDDEVEGFLTMGFDPTPVAAPPISRKPAPAQPQPENRAPRDYFGSTGKLSAKPPTREGLREDQRSASSRSVSTERDLERQTSKSSSHILSQDKGRHPSGRKRDVSSPSTPANGSVVTSPVAHTFQDKSQRQTPQPLVTESQSHQAKENFALEDVPHHKKVGSKSNVEPQALVSPIENDAATNRASMPPGSPVSMHSRNSSVNPFDDPKRRDAAGGASPPPPKGSLPLRVDSLNAVARHAKQPSQDQFSPPPLHKRQPSTASVPSTFVDAKSTLSRDNSRAKPTDPNANRSSFEAPPPRSSSRPDASGKLTSNDEVATPRGPPPPVPGHRNHESISTMHTEDRRSLEVQAPPAVRSPPLATKDANEGNSSMSDELRRILQGEKREGGDALPSSVLDRVSNAVKYGKSFSERESTRSEKSPPNGTVDISSPMALGTPSISSPTPTNQSQESIDQVRASLRRAQVQIAELETDKLSLLEQLNGSTEIKAVNTELREKRSTMAILDTQREMIVRELEIMTEHLARAKDANEPFDLGSMQTSILKNFAGSLQKLKDNMSSQIEDLIRRRNELTDEITNLIQMKDKGFQEYESLSNRNTQLLQHNNDLLRNIQGVYQDNRGSGSSASNTNGLGIYHTNSKGDGPPGSEMRDFRVVNTDPSMPNIVQESDAEPATILNGPHVVNIRKGGKPTKFNWRKGGESLAKNVKQGIKGAFAADRLPQQSGAIGVPYSSTQQTTAGSEISSLSSTRVPTEDGRSGSNAGFGFFGQKNGSLKTGGLANMKDNSSSNLASPDGSVLFGSELQARCDYESRLVPNIVSRCIQEVEQRGMNVEGIYRKSGGAGQVKSVQQGFEKDPEHPISDPDLEIHAVTSALKQYFRKLPTPLIGYDVYDSILEAGQMTTDRDKQVVALKLAIHDLPDVHRDCLQYLIQHLARVMAHESQNLMTALNLAVVFAPTIMRPLSIEREMTDVQTQRAAVQALLENHRSIFPE